MVARETYTKTSAPLIGGMPSRECPHTQWKLLATVLYAWADRGPRLRPVCELCPRNPWCLLVEGTAPVPHLGLALNPIQWKLWPSFNDD